MVEISYSQVFKEGLLDESQLGFESIDPPPGAPEFYNLRCAFKNGKWQEPRITTNRFMPELRMEAGCLYYGHQWFEGVVAHMTKDGRCLLFRLHDHFLRAKRSSEILMMEVVPEEIFKYMVQEVIKQNAVNLPRYGTGARLYIRPYLIGTNPQIKLGPSKDFLFIVFAYPVGNYFSTGFKSKKIYCSPVYDRVGERSTGEAKAGGNYVASYPAGRLAKEKECEEFLYVKSNYLDTATRSRITETGSSNFFGLQAGKTYVTPYEPGIVLESITNASLQLIVQRLMGFNVERRRMDLEELKVKGGSCQYLEAALCGTAARVAPVNAIVYEDFYGKRRREFTFPNVGKTSAPWCQELYCHLKNIQHGDEQYEWSAPWIEEVKLT